MIILENGKTMDATGMKDTYGRVLCEFAEKDPRFVYLDADLARPSGALGTIGKAHPDRLFDCGIMEANMMGVANGMSSAGLIPFAHTFSCFVARKCLDSIFLTGCFANQNVKMIGSDPGVTAEQNGASHAGIEEMGILRNVPNLTLVDPCDPIAFEAVMRAAMDTYGMFYIRYNRKAVRKIYAKGGEFTIGKGNVLCEGNDVTIIAAGIMVSEAMDAREMLAAEGISARIVDMFTWKPIDEELICKCAEETGALVTAENHSLLTGLGAAVASVTAQKCPVPIEMIGVNDQFGQVGMLEDQKKFYFLRAEDIVAKVKKAIARKK